ncbi:hypothetical protein [Plantactinospora endophytica]|uniref:hypothetical protein n=1 Tax=Plantactinospora endophytica TaxID=673535 RepID=UPI0036283D6E
MVPPPRNAHAPPRDGDDPAYGGPGVPPARAYPIGRSAPTARAAESGADRPRPPTRPRTALIGPDRPDGRERR